MNTSEYLTIIENIKSEIIAAQYRATIHVNADMLLLYYDIGCVINEHKSWGNKFIDNLAADIRIAFPESKGYSVFISLMIFRNFKTIDGATESSSTPILTNSSVNNGSAPSSPHIPAHFPALWAFFTTMRIIFKIAL